MRKLRKRIHLPADAEVIDIAASEEFASSNPLVQEQVETLQAIQEYNKALPKSRKVKDALPEITTNNIGATKQIRRDFKKGTVEMVTKYHQVGIVDGCVKSELSDDKYSLASK